MAKKIIRLTESELNQIIKEATAKVMNEMDAATYSRIHNASHRAMQDIQNGNYERTVNGRDFINNDDIISRADSMEQNVQRRMRKGGHSVLQPAFGNDSRRGLALEHCLPVIVQQRLRERKEAFA